MKVSAQAPTQAELVASALRKDIIAGTLPGETVLRQEAVADQFQISRMPVRDAFRILEREKLLVMTPNKRATVSRISADDLREIYEMRSALECLALKLAIPELTNSTIDRAEELQCEAENGNLSEFASMNKAFHMTLFAPCARRNLLALIDGLEDRSARYLHFAASKLDYAKRSHREHRALINACRMRGSAMAISILHDHIEEAGATLCAKL